MIFALLHFINHFTERDKYDDMNVNPLIEQPLRFEENPHESHHISGKISHAEHTYAYIDKYHQKISLISVILSIVFFDFFMYLRPTFVVSKFVEAKRME